MGKLIYSALTSLDGFVADEDGNFDWAAPDPDVHAAVNDLMRRVGTHLYGRRMYEVLVAWESDDILVDQPAYMHDFANIWRAADKIVYSRSLESVSSARTRRPRRASSRAMVPAITDLPAPPLPTTTTRSGRSPGGQSTSATTPGRLRAGRRPTVLQNWG